MKVDSKRCNNFPKTKNNLRIDIRLTNRGEWKQGIKPGLPILIKDC